MIIFLFFLFNFIYSKVQHLQQLLSEQKRFYQNLFKTNNSVKDSDSTEAFLNSLNIIPNYRKNKGDGVKDGLLPRNAGQL